MNLFKKYWYKNESRLKGYAYITKYHQDAQSDYISQAMIKQIIN